MKQRLFNYLAVLMVAFAGCKKEGIKNNVDEFQGMWVKGISAGDTLFFSKKNNLNILTYNASFNAAHPAVTEMEYNYINEKLAVKNFMTAGTGLDFYPLPSFTWIKAGKEFEIRAIELFPIVSSTDAKFTYKKIN